VLPSESRAQREGLDRDLGVLGGVLDLPPAPGIDEGSRVTAALLVERLDSLAQSSCVSVCGGL